MVVRQLPAAFSTVCKVRTQFGSAVRAEAEVAAVRPRIALRRVAETDVQRVWLLTVLHNVEGGAAVFPSGVFEVVHRLDDAQDDEQHTEQRKEERRTHGRGGNGPENAENNDNDGAQGTHG